MRLSFVTILLTAFCIFFGAKRRSDACPVIFLVTSGGTNGTTSRGVSFSKDGRYVDPRVDVTGSGTALLSQIRRYFSECADVIPVRVVDENTPDLETKIGRWTERKCVANKKRSHCFLLTDDPKLFSDDSEAAFGIKVAHSVKRLVDVVEGLHELRTVVRNSIVTREFVTTKAPTVKKTKSPTMLPTLAPNTPCEFIPPGKCNTESCAWFGDEHKCRERLFCGFTTRIACESRWNVCEWKKRRCRTRRGAVGRIVHVL